MAHFVYVTPDGGYLAGKQSWPNVTSDLQSARVFNTKSAAKNAGSQSERPRSGYGHPPGLQPAQGSVVEILLTLKDD